MTNLITKVPLVAVYLYSINDKKKKEALTSFMLSNAFADCRKVETLKKTEASVKHNKAVIKTIKAEGDDLIDCVDIYKQPALNHPLLKNHTIQLKPSGTETVSGVQDEIFQSWSRNGECPDGTIPIVRRTQGFEHPPSKTMPQFEPNKFELIPPPHHEYAQVSLYGGEYYGAQAGFNVWNPAAYNEDNSIAQIWVVRGNGKALNSVEAGWIRMNPRDNRTLLFTFWTGDGYQSTGCYNLECPGFVQTSKKFALGVPISPISGYNGKQYDTFISIYKNTNSGHWWLQVQNEAIGYWPDTILPNLRGSAELVSWGGEIYDSQAEGHHTSTQMGSGHFPDEGFGKASYVRNLQYMDDSSPLTFKDPAGLLTSVTKPSCYNLIVKDKTPDMGTHFYYGGPGFSATCP
ncbi:Protein of Unknown Function D [Prunus dulcis]|uniref:Neprosin PEP catalytic domain-containing protein n=1 Tax=Prunus dulcis TaxID=3755 RepID=A0A4Y1R465_PRUDU|nr:Protein of Unknown Function D [Prunus dulcis]